MGHWKTHAAVFINVVIMKRHGVIFTLDITLKYRTRM